MKLPTIQRNPRIRKWTVEPAHWFPTIQSGHDVSPTHPHPMVLRVAVTDKGQINLPFGKHVLLNLAKNLESEVRVVDRKFRIRVS